MDFAVGRCEGIVSLLRNDLFAIERFQKTGDLVPEGNGLALSFEYMQAA
jgi:hypothetical protein